MASQLEWDERFLQLAQTVAQWSKDPSTKVGAVIVDTKHRILSLGFNGLPRGIDDSTARLADRDTKLRLTLHAEHNAVLFSGADIAGATIYTTAPPCAQCAALLIQVAIARIVHPAPSPAFAERWQRDMVLAAEAMDEAGVIRTILAQPQIGTRQ